MNAINKILPAKLNFGLINNLQPINNFKKVSGSNSAVAKFVFLLLVIFIFIITLRLGINILTYIYSYKSNPILINGRVDANKLLIIPQNPNNKESIPIFRSNNERGGLEFTWSVWLYIKEPPIAIDTASQSAEYKHVFNKGNDTDMADGIVTLNNGPGLYIGKDYRSLRIIMDTIDDKKEDIIIGGDMTGVEIPIEKWINVIIRCNQHNFDIYINGTLTKSLILDNIPKQNYDNVNVALNGGFSGYISLLHYYAYAIGSTEIENIVDAGPNLKITGKSADKNMEIAKPHYLSYRWFFPEQF